MCNLYERIENLCKKNGVSVTQLCREAGVPRANLTELKMGRQQSLGAGTIAKIAEFFDVSSDYLVTGKEKSPEAEASELSDEALKREAKRKGEEVLEFEDWAARELRDFACKTDDPQESDPFGIFDGG